MDTGLQWKDGIALRSRTGHTQLYSTHTVNSNKSTPFLKEPVPPLALTTVMSMRSVLRRPRLVNNNVQIRNSTGPSLFLYTVGLSSCELHYYCFTVDKEVQSMRAGVWSISSTQRPPPWLTTGVTHPVKVCLWLTGGNGAMSDKQETAVSHHGDGWRGWIVAWYPFRVGGKNGELKCKSSPVSALIRTTGL